MRILVPVKGTPECEISIPLVQERNEKTMRILVPINGTPEDELVSRYELPADRTRCLVGRSDNAADEIVTIAQNNGIDLIVVSGHRRSWPAPHKPAVDITQWRPTRPQAPGQRLPLEISASLFAATMRGPAPAAWPVASRSGS